MRTGTLESLACLTLALGCQTVPAAVPAAMPVAVPAAVPTHASAVEDVEEAHFVSHPFGAVPAPNADFLKRFAELAEVEEECIASPGMAFISESGRHYNARAENAARFALVLRLAAHLTDMERAWLRRFVAEIQPPSDDNDRAAPRLMRFMDACDILLVAGEPAARVKALIPYMIAEPEHVGMLYEMVEPDALRLSRLLNRR